MKAALHVCLLVPSRSNAILPCPFLSFQVSLQGGLHRTVTAAAKMAKGIKKEKVAHPAMNSPPQAVTASRKPAPLKRLSSAVRSPGSPTYRLWIDQSKKARYNFFSSLKFGEKVTCSEL